ncbi:hypothetical protein TrVE_jg3687 [Triparma verrucosa]|uniref:Uncharacterized protein n=1 Tax=Triparma verrucosa TaxID=1606542 RepID=A0A9W7CEK0_9STRA|nr:hypothetical protein TrVE_jg3687 [Triparma verrucosa]
MTAISRDDLLDMLRGAPQIKDLGLYEYHSGTFPSLADILDAAPNLEELHTGFASEDVVTRLHGLRRLSISNTDKLEDRHLMQISVHLHKLEEAEFAYSLDNVSPDAFVAFVRSTPTLKVATYQGIDEREDVEDDSEDEEGGDHLTPDHPMWIEAQEILQERRGTPFRVWGYPLLKEERDRLADLEEKKTG